VIRFRNRLDAGQQLAASLTPYAGRADVVVLGLPRGGVPVASAVAAALKAPLDVFLVRKLGVPGHEELALGAIAQGDVMVLNHDIVGELGIPSAAIDRVVARERQELARREERYRGGRPPLALTDRVAILVDDGLATGATMEAAVVAARAMKPARVVVASPVGTRDACSRIGRVADDVVCLTMPEPFNAVGLWYEDFAETSDEEVRNLLN
jgi:putative phosphoribosyl transferase